MTTPTQVQNPLVENHDRIRLFSAGGLEPLDHVAGELKAGRAAVLCVVVETQGSTPQVEGALMSLDAAGRQAGTIGGGGCLEAEVRRAARELLHVGGARRFAHRLDHDPAVQDGMICGGEMTVAAVVLPPGRSAELAALQERIAAGQSAVLELVLPAEGRAEPGGGAESPESAGGGKASAVSRAVTYALHLEPPPALIICGAGHVGIEVAWLAARVGFAVSVLDDRPDFLVAGRFPPGTRTVAGVIVDELARLSPDPNTYMVIATRGHRDDLEAIAAMIDRPLRYLGMLGSRRKVATLFRELRARGAQESDLERVLTPIGLDLGAETPAEIAVSIVAQLIAVRRRRVAGREAMALAAGPGGAGRAAMGGAR